MRNASTHFKFSAKQKRWVE